MVCSFTKVFLTKILHWDLLIKWLVIEKIRKNSDFSLQSKKEPQCKTFFPEKQHYKLVWSKWFFSSEKKSLNSHQRLTYSCKFNWHTFLQVVNKFLLICWTFQSHAEGSRNFKSSKICPLLADFRLVTHSIFKICFPEHSSVSSNSVQFLEYRVATKFWDKTYARFLW